MNKLFLNDKYKFKKITSELKKIIKYPHCKNKSLFILMAGVPCSGKTYLTKKIEEKYNALVINKDSIMEINSRCNLVSNTEENELQKNQYLFSLLKDNPFQNKLVLIDGSIDRHYKEILDFCKKESLEYFLIEVNISKKAMIEIIHKRNPDNLDNWLPRVDKWIQEHKDFRKHNKVDIKLNGTNPNLDELYLKLDRLLV